MSAIHSASATGDSSRPQRSSSLREPAQTASHDAAE